MSICTQQLQLLSAGLPITLVTLPTASVLTLEVHSAGITENKDPETASLGDVEYSGLRARTNHHREALQLLQGS